MKSKTLILALLVLTSGCSLFPFHATSKKLENNSTSLAANSGASEQGAAGAVQGATQALQADPEGNKFTAVAQRELQVAAAYLPKVQPWQILDINNRLKLALSETAAERDKANGLYTKELSNAQGLQEENAKLKAERTKLQGDLAAAQAREESHVAMMNKIVWVLTIAGIICSVGAVLSLQYMHALTVPSAILAVVFFGLAYVAAIIEPWMVYTALGICFACGIGYVLVLHREKVTADGAVGFIEEAKAKSDDWWKANEATAKDWLGKADSTVGRYISAKLTKLNLK